MDFETWKKDPWAVECSVYCPYIGTGKGGCSICEKLGNKKPEKSCLNCDDYIDFEGVEDYRYTCTPVRGFCKKDKGLIARPYEECLADRLNVFE